jgi:2-C-methyl-D-erythritol 2,4-cyclodiphosphate synthase
MKDIRIGFGYDIHRTKKGRDLILGGVKIKSDFGIDGHSDADVLLHSICDALLGAAGFEDIGHQFPNTDAKYKNISSLKLLERTYKMISSKKWKIKNIDSTIILESPKISKYIPEMKKKISGIIKSKNISIKATTSEKLGDTGKGKGCEAFAITLLYK